MVQPIYISEEKWCSWCNINIEICEYCSENDRIWFEESDYCENYKWCKYCDEVGENNERYRNRTTHNSQDCQYKLSVLSTTDEWGLKSKSNEEWNMEKIECSICSTKK
ncbi:6431_t:CDS:2 [Gigaspora margarita]|uniref:6431_t:CDS:1 n=1 Tax=Gigaspora margarita TaxID=4874 RepID=A0ABN7UX75_GIGMA|nr:6431_t:CDS:2 [Gigaspora margarita]